MSGIILMSELVKGLCPDVRFKPASNENYQLSECPVCHNKGDGKWSKAYISDSKGSFFCFSCCPSNSANSTANGGFLMVGLYREATGDNAANMMDIKKLLGRYIYIKNEKRYNSSVPAIHTKPPVPPSAKTAPLANIADRDMAYSRLLELSPVCREADMRNLLSRGFTEGQINENGYKGCPDFWEAARIMDQMTEEGYALSGIPGIYQENGIWRLVHKNGFYIPVRDACGRIQGLQIKNAGLENIKIAKTAATFYDKTTYRIAVQNNNRFPVSIKITDPISDKATLISQSPMGEGVKDGGVHWQANLEANETKIFVYEAYVYGHEVEKKPSVTLRNKYTWFSSGNRANGAATNSFVHVAGSANQTMYMTEGPLKADAARALSGGKWNFIANAGAGVLSSLKPVIQSLAGNGLRKIKLVFDMDKESNANVRTAIDKVAQICSGLGIECEEISWDISLGKGVDDFVLNWLSSHAKKQISI